MKEPGPSLRSRLLRPIRLFNKHVFNKLTIALARSGRGPFSLLRHAGRRTGLIYTTPVLATCVGDVVLIPLSYGEQVDWLRNVLAAGGCDMQYRSESIRLTKPEIIDAELALSVLPESRRRLFQRFRLEEFVRMQAVPPNEGR